jgi:transketolase
MKAPAASEALTRLAINTIKFLSVDAVDKAKSGHPGLPLGAADYAFVLWSRYLRFNPRDPAWPDRDRFVLSAGHGSALLYSLLYLAGYDLSLDDLKQFRQWGSKTPGHPERGHTPGVEVTTGPLGQGVGNAVGLAMAQQMMASRYNTPQRQLYSHRTYCLAGDGDLMEGISHEACSVAGHLGLANLTMFFDDNLVTLSGPTSAVENDDVVKRFESYGWFVQRVDGYDLPAFERTLDAALNEKDRPQLIACRTILGHGAPKVQGTFKAHGEPLEAEDVAALRKALGWPAETFVVPPEVRELFQQRVRELTKEYDAWQATRSAWEKENPDQAREWTARIAGQVPSNLFEELRPKKPQEKPEATRNLGADMEQLVAARVPALVGGSADLDPSTKTIIKDSPKVSRKAFTGRNTEFGIREHAMGSICNGIAASGGFIPFGATFLIFSDYMRPPIRLAALSKLHVIYVFTHDSVLLGEDGPTHEPVEQLGGLRLVPNLHVVRPADQLETAAAWEHAVTRTEGPTALIFSRQKLPPLERPADFDPNLVRRGAYRVNAVQNANLLLLATGSEVGVMADAAKQLAGSGYRAQVVSLPCLEIFDAQDQSYRDSVLPKGIRRVSLEAGRSEPWKRWVGDEGLALGIDRFGASAPEKVIAEHLWLTPAGVVAKVLERFGKAG